MKKQIISWSIALMIIFTSLSVTSFASETSPFFDLSTEHWSYSYVAYMVEKGVINGYPDGSFRPEEPFSRAAFAKLMYFAFDLPSPEAYIDYVDLPSSNWAYEYIQAASPYLTYFEYEGSNYYAPNEDSVREDVAVAMVTAASLDQMYEPDYAYLDRFTDAGEISPNLVGYIALAVEYGIMQGSGTTFNPMKSLSRAEACTVFARYLMAIEALADTPNQAEQHGGWKLVRSEFIKSDLSTNTADHYERTDDTSSGNILVKLYDADFNRYLTDYNGYDIKGLETWSGIPEFMVANERYTITLGVSLENYFNPERAYVSSGLSISNGYHEKLDEPKHTIMKLANGEYALIFGLSSDSTDGDKGVMSGDNTTVTIKAGSSSYSDKYFTIVVYDTNVFKYIYTYEWVD